MRERERWVRGRLRESERTRDTRTLFHLVKCLSKFTHRRKDCDAFSRCVLFDFVMLIVSKTPRQYILANRSEKKNHDLEVIEYHAFHFFEQNQQLQIEGKNN